MRTTPHRQGSPDRGRSGHFRPGRPEAEKPQQRVPPHPRRGDPDRSRTGSQRGVDLRKETRNRLLSQLALTWIELEDTEPSSPTAYVGKNGHAVVVNDEEDGLDIAASSSANSADLAPEDSVFEYNSDGSVSIIDFPDSGRDLVFTYNADGTIDTIEDNGLGFPPAHTKTFTYNSDGSLDNITVT